MTDPCVREKGTGGEKKKTQAGKRVGQECFRVDNRDWGRVRGAQICDKVCLHPCDIILASTNEIQHGAYLSEEQEYVRG